MFSDLVHTHYDFKISLGMSGTFLEQAETYKPEVIDVLKGLLDVGQNTRQVEFLEQPYYYSTASFFTDPRKTEFKEQVSLHRQRMHDVFGVKPCAFLNTALSYSNEVANIVADMGFKAILCEPGDKTVSVRDHKPIDANRVYRAVGRKGRPAGTGRCCPGTRCSASGWRRSATRWPDSSTMADSTQNANPPSATALAQQNADLIREVGGEVAVLICDFPLVENDSSDYGRMVEYWRALVDKITRCDDIVPSNPTEVAEWFQITECPRDHPERFGFVGGMCHARSTASCMF